VKEVFGSFINGVFCSFLRIHSGSEPYYVVTADIDRTITCRVTSDRMDNWTISDPENHAFFASNEDEILNIIQKNEAGTIILIDLP
jgi:hypothetical protein